MGMLDSAVTGARWIFWMQVIGLLTGIAGLTGAFLVSRTQNNGGVEQSGSSSGS